MEKVRTQRMRGNNCKLFTALVCLALLWLFFNRVTWADQTPKQDPRVHQKIKQLIKAAEQGNASAQFTLGFFYDVGFFVPEDFAEALKWFRKAAKQNYVGAQLALAHKYEEGLGVAKDYAKAAEWYRRAAEQNCAEAQYNLGLMYANGTGVIQSGAVAADWFYKAGVNYLKAGKTLKALICLERIQDLKSKLHLSVPNYFLAEKLMRKIYGSESTSRTSPLKR